MPYYSADEALDTQETSRSLKGCHCCCGRNLTPANAVRRYIGHAKDGLPSFELWCLTCVEAGEMGEPGDPNG